MKRAILLLVLLTACGKTDSGSAGAEKTVMTNDSVGIAECEEYVKKWGDCISRMPAPAKSAAEPAFRQMRESWKQTATTPEGKTTLKNACRAQLDALATNPACK